METPMYDLLTIGPKLVRQHLTHSPSGDGWKGLPGDGWAKTVESRILYCKRLGRVHIRKSGWSRSINQGTMLCYQFYYSITLEPRSAPEERGSAVRHHLRENTHDRPHHCQSESPSPPLLVHPCLWPWKPQTAVSREGQKCLPPSPCRFLVWEETFNLDKWD